MLLTDVVGRPVLSASDAVRLGTVDGLLVDPATARVVSLRLKDGIRSRSVLPWPDLHAVGPDAVMVSPREEPPALVKDAEEHSGKGSDAAGPTGWELVGERVLTEYGDGLGAVRDFDFDPGTGRVLRLIAEAGEVPGDAMMRLGSYALVVRVPPTAPEG